MSIIILIGIILFVFVVYILLCNIIPFIIPKSISKDKKKQFQRINFYSEKNEIGVDSVTLLETTEDGLNARIEVIRSAKDTLDIAYHLIHGDSSSMLFLDEVMKSANQGVKVRILFDGMICIDNTKSLKYMRAIAMHPNIAYKLYNPIKIMQPYKIQPLLHDKFILVDNKLLILGGRNINDRHYGTKEFKGPLSFDRDVLIFRNGDLKDNDGSVIHQMNQYFKLLWNYKDSNNVEGRKENQEEIVNDIQKQAIRFKEENPKFFNKLLNDYDNESKKTKKITLITNPIDTKIKEPWLACQMYLIALTAKKEIIIQTPYMTANKKMIRIMKEVKEKVNNISLLTNSLASSPNFPAFSNYYSHRKKFLDTGIAIYEYQKEHSIHGKSMIVDDRLAVVGSFNLDDRSIYLDTETMLVIDSQDFVVDLKKAMNHILDTSLLVDKETNQYVVNPQVKELSVDKKKKQKMKLVAIFSRIFQFLI